jgi:hypothetical protein
MTTPWAAPSSIDIEGDYGQNAVGNQVHGDLVQSMTTFVRGHPSMYLGSAEVANRVACYVPARNHDLVVKALDVNHAIVLTGSWGSGRETTAIAAMHQLRPGIQIRRFSLEDEDAEEIDAKRAYGYLIHAEDGGITRLGRCAEAVRASDGYLAVVAEREIHEAAALLPSILLEPPDPVQVYRRQVTIRGLDEWPHWSQAAILLEAALPADARRLADLVAQADQRSGDITAQQTEVANAYRGWKDELRNWFSEHREPHERALLVAATTLPSVAEEAYVYAAASSLAQRLQIDMNGGGLAWCPVTGLRSLLGAEQEDGRITFRRIGYADSALRHALADFPLARADLLAWLAALPTAEAAIYGMANTVAGTFADLAAEHGAADDITKTARTWGLNKLADLAFIALSRTCLHPRVGAQVRRALYDWSRTTSTPQTLKLTIARVCEPLGQTHLSIALTRLKHLVTHGNRQVADEAIVTARALADQGHRREVLAAALSWCAETNRENLADRARQRRRRAGAMLFLELARPVSQSGMPEILNGDQATDPALCVPGWRAVLDFLIAPGTGNEAVEQVLRQWLDAALRHVRVRNRISAVFVTSAVSPLMPSDNVSRIVPTRPSPATAEILIDVVQHWAVAGPADTIRGEIKDDIVIPLTRPWWLRLLKVLRSAVQSHP